MKIVKQEHLLLALDVMEDFMHRGCDGNDQVYHLALNYAAMLKHEFDALKPPKTRDEAIQRAREGVKYWPEWKKEMFNPELSK